MSLQVVCGCRRASIRPKLPEDVTYARFTAESKRGIRACKTSLRLPRPPPNHRSKAMLLLSTVPKRCFCCRPFQNRFLMSTFIKRCFCCRPFQNGVCVVDSSKAVLVVDRSKEVFLLSTVPKRCFCCGLFSLALFCPRPFCLIYLG